MMQTNKLFNLGMTAVLALFLAACSTTDTDVDSTPEPQPETTAPVADSGADARGAGRDAGLTAAQIRERDAALATTVFYFEFDRSELSAEAREALIHHANRLNENSSLRYRLEGHTDERGTREYNMALGERRAQAVERYLLVQGVSPNQLEVISFGEERPAVMGTTEAAYARNRRVEIH